MGKTEFQLPAEVAVIAEKVSAEKRNEVLCVLNSVFEGVGQMRQQLDAVNVASENDEVSMKLARTIRLAVRERRLDAEKAFDAKREEVQAKMLSFKTEDSLWLKAKQTMQILTKEIESIALYKEETRKRWDHDQKELKITERLLKLSKFAPHIQRFEIENMSDSTFESFSKAAESEFIEAQESEKRAIEERERIAKEQEIERQRIEAENEKLRKEREEREKALAEERKKVEAERRIADEKLRKEREEREKIERELEAKKQEEIRKSKELEDKKKEEEKARILAEKKAAAAPDKEKLIAFANEIKKLSAPNVKSEEAKVIADQINELINRLNFFILDKASTL
ncbi:hypothetical protein UFOVP754_32 [uncultured Caudovirales phage]|uniref:Uncharacterized protein n=1 Tax=uncultured Caudovirales phage TaxID=2100421 RepID=A0A6J7X8U2_9CAUD|nr:hypothetical protein UFOVP754_32 [uncultured Caudovirales phage]